MATATSVDEGDCGEDAVVRAKILSFQRNCVLRHWQSETLK